MVIFLHQIFVANPNKTQPIRDILIKNKAKLVEFLENFHTDRAGCVELEMSMLNLKHGSFSRKNLNVVHILVLVANNWVKSSGHIISGTSRVGGCFRVKPPVCQKGYIFWPKRCVIMEFFIHGIKHHEANFFFRFLLTYHDFRKRPCSSRFHRWCIAT